MPIACLRIPSFPLRIALLDRPEMDGHPMVRGNPEGGRPIVMDANAEAVEQGVRPGMTLREARAMCPAVVIVAPNPVREAAIAQEITDRLDGISPLVELDDSELGCWYVDLKGLGRHQTVDGLATLILSCAPTILKPRVGITEDRFSARVAAIAAKPGSIRRVSAEDTTAFLRRAPVSCLPLPMRDILQIQRLGITTLGAFSSIPAHKLAARFGPGAAKAWQMAAGLDVTPVTPPPRDASVRESLVMPMATTSRDMLMVGLRQMVNHAFSRPELRDRHVRQVTIQAVLEGSSRSWERLLHLKEPSGPTRVIRAIELRLQDLMLAGAVEALTLVFRGLSHSVGRQLPADGMGSRATAPLHDALSQLKSRYGYLPLYTVVEVEPWSRYPERRYALAPTTTNFAR
jgi:nucleotidyltransferase/DNA polymerase involved in DNA repair